VIRAVVPADAVPWRRLRASLWPDTPVAEHDTDIMRFFWSLGTDAACLVAEVDDTLVGFIELAIRGYAEGCETDRVGYVEGWYVEPARRRQGVGRALMAAGEAWAQSCGCSEFASDALLEHRPGHQAHLALGFAEVDRIICYRKSLVPEYARRRAHPRVMA
jgi:aminoglycoside 6'-N-acetyltransferase I